MAKISIPAHDPDGALSNVAFRTAMRELGYSLEGMAARLQLSRRLIALYRDDRRIPPHVAYAVRMLLVLHRRCAK